jgi:hypothetical protein
MKEIFRSPELSQNAAKAFTERWKSVTDEKQYADTFWSDFFQNLCGVEDEQIAGIEHQKRVKSSVSGNQEYIDIYWKNVALIEHKSAGLSLDKAELQARGYWLSLSPGYRPKTIVISDFQNFRLIDVALNRTHEFRLTDLPENIHRFEAIISGNRARVSQEEITVDQQAAKLMANLYLELEDHGFEGHETSVFLIRILFLLFGDDTGMWDKNLFLKLVLGTKEDGSDVGPMLDALFEVLNTAAEERSNKYSDAMKDFPYVNGGIFSEKISVIDFNKKMRVALVDVANYDWTTINPTIFGSLFQLIKSKDERAALGEHYTSEENINKIIYPLFLDKLQEQLASAWDSKKELKKLRQELTKIKILDPACGCGNFLVVAYRHLRQLELELIVRLSNLEGKQDVLQLDGSMGLSINLNQFFGIEIEEWPSRIAAIALFLTDHQENLKLERITGATPNRFPISEAASIFKGNALTTEWNDLLKIDSDTYILGNPPFIGYSMQSLEQREIQINLWGKNSGAGILDFVCNWYLIAAQQINKHSCKAAFVSTNSITQGEQPYLLWKPIHELKVGINFAHRTFAWSNEGGNQAAVHCVIIGIQLQEEVLNPIIFDYENINADPHSISVKQINAYLVDAPNVLIASRKEPIAKDLPKMDYGSKPTDAGFLSDIDKTSSEEIISKDAIASKYLRKLIGAQELLNGKERFCFWLVDASPKDIASSKILRNAIEGVRKFRKASSKKTTQRDAETPALFQEIRQPKSSYIAVPLHSTENRKYIPMAYFKENVIATNALSTIEGGSLAHFAILQSKVFTTWTAAVSGRIKSDFRISAEITYNNFPAPVLVNENVDSLEKSAKEILRIREIYDEDSLSSLYGINSMPPDLYKAHTNNDELVMKIFGINQNASDQEVLKKLFELYLELSPKTLFTHSTRP